MSEKMIVACPQCETRFVAPIEQFLPDGRKVRCAKCKHQWFYSVEDVRTATIEVSKIAPELEFSVSHNDSILDRAMDQINTIDAFERDQTNHPSTSALADAADELKPTLKKVSEAELSPETTTPSRSFWKRIFLYPLAGLVLAAVGAYFFSAPLSEKFPSAAPQLAAWHKTVQGVVTNAIPSEPKLLLQNVSYNFEKIEGGRALLLTAEVANDSDGIRQAPQLTVRIFGVNGTILEETDIFPEDMVTKINPQNRVGYFLRLPFPPDEFDRVEVDFAAPMRL